MTQLSDEEGRVGLALARRAVEAAVQRSHPVPGELSPVFFEPRGVFVTLTRDGELRGCIGLPYPVAPLGQAIIEAGASAALQDPRFSPVAPGELDRVRVELTVLTTPIPLSGPPSARPDSVKVGRHGLIVRGHGTSGLLLPQVATEYGWNATEFLDQTCRKAGLPAGCWRRPEIEVSLFEGQIFKE
ncbi:MAG: TIGR00296 family protein [Methanoregulaceae archaeon]